MFRSAVYDFHSHKPDFHKDKDIENKDFSELWEEYNDERPKALPLMLWCSLLCYAVDEIPYCIVCTIMANPALFLPYKN